MSANVRHNIGTIFTHSSSVNLRQSVRPARPSIDPRRLGRIDPLGEGAALTRSLAVPLDTGHQTSMITANQSMEIDQISDVSDLEEPTEPYSIETPTGEHDSTQAFTNAMQTSQATGAEALPMVSEPVSYTHLRAHET